MSWGLEDKDNSSASFEIDGKSCTDVRIEQAYKGNFHLYASIDGRECKFIIGKNKPEYATIQETGLSNLPETMLRDLVAKYLVDRREVILLCPSFYENSWDLQES